MLGDMKSWWLSGDIMLLTVHRIDDDDDEPLATALPCNCSNLFIDETCNSQAFVMKDNFIVSVAASFLLLASPRREDWLTCAPPHFLCYWNRSYFGSGPSGTMLLCFPERRVESFGGWNVDARESNHSSKKMLKA